MKNSKTLRALREVFISSLPLVAVIVVVCCFVEPLSDPNDYIKLIVGYVSVIFGQALFLVGLDNSILPIGKFIGGSLVDLKKTIFIIFFGFLFGLLSTVAEPALAVLARQTNMILVIINETVFLWIMGAGIGVAVGFALYRIMKDISIKKIFAAVYIFIFAIVIFVPQEFIALAFDASGATTGDISVPFILALGMGISATMSKHKTNEDSFGIIGLASGGPIIAMFIYGIIVKVTNGGVIPPAATYDPGAVQSLSLIFKENFHSVAFALFPVVLLFLPFQIFLIKLPKREFARILLGSVPVYFGLLFFLSGIDYGFAFAAKYIGEVFLNPSRPDWFKWLLLLVGFILGAAITLSEPGVTVLGEQLETLTNGHIKKMTIRLTLAIGIGVSASLAMVKILTQINILWFLVPLYAIALIMMKFSSNLFVGLAFDSGGVSGGALSSAFLTPLTLGAAQAVAKASGPGAQSVLTNGFGIIAFISVMPLIAVQTLGIIYDRQRRKVLQELETEEISDLVDLIALDEDSYDYDDEIIQEEEHNYDTASEDTNDLDDLEIQEDANDLDDLDDLDDLEIQVEDTDDSSITENKENDDELSSSDSKVI